MKKSILTLLVLVPLLGFGQTTTEFTKAKLSAKSYLLKKLNNPSSYQSASWSKLRKTFSTFDESKESKAIDDSLEYYRVAKNSVHMNARTISMKNVNYRRDSTWLRYKVLETKIDSATKHLIDIRVEKENSFKRVFDGYIIDHSFRARNKFNALVINNWYFVLSRTFKVIAAGDADEHEEERKKLQDEIEGITNKNN